MASNGLVANPKKTSFVILNLKGKKNELCSLRIGNEIVYQEKSAKLLGLTFDSNQAWQTQIYGSGGTIMSLNRRLFLLSRLKNHLSKASILKMADGIFTSKIRYGLQMMGKVRMKESDPTNKDFESIQKVQNKLLRMLTNTKLLDMISTQSLLQKTNMMSVNQMNCQIKIQEIWKALNIPAYPIDILRQTPHDNGPATRAGSSGRLIEAGHSLISQKTCINDAVRLWNQLPIAITKCNSLAQIKTQAKMFAKTLPI